MIKLYTLASRAEDEAIISMEQNPLTLHNQIKQKGYDLKVAYVEGDNLLPIINDLLKDGPLPHLDSNNPDVHVAEGVVSFVNNKDKPIVSANAYLGAREIVKGLEEGADIVIAGRVADASPVCRRYIL